MEWSEEKCFQLISVYQQHELLWQARHPQHYNKLKKQDTWEEIAQEINTDPVSYTHLDVYKRQT